MKKKFIILKNLIKTESKYFYIKSLKREKYMKFLEKEYKVRTGKKLDLKSPRTYTEKMQFAKLHKNTPLKTELTDKYKVRKWVSEKIGEKHLIPLLGVWDRFKDIKFDELPSKFVLKTNHSSGWNLVVKDKDEINYKKEKLKFNRWMKKNFAYSGDLQLHYKEIEPKIIAEEFIEDSNGKLTDYKFFCFDGKVHFCWIDEGRFSNHYRNVYDLNWDLLPWTQHNYSNTPYPLNKPENFEKMIEIANVLCQGFSHVRVDLYNVDGEIYFGEMTFTNGSGYELIHPDKFNTLLGELWDLNIEDNGR